MTEDWECLLVYTTLKRYKPGTTKNGCSPNHHQFVLVHYSLFVFYTLQACGDANSKPAFLSDKTLESSIKLVIKKFPNIDVKGV